jgi:succinate-acetate transporter protein
MAVGNTFGATALSSYGGFWIAFAIVLTPGGFSIEANLIETGGTAMFYNSFGLFLMVSDLRDWLCACCGIKCANTTFRDGSSSLPSSCSAP